jgi:hypothetical protein
MKLQVDKKKLNDNFLIPINRLTDSCVIIAGDKNLSTLTHNEQSGDTIILYGLLKIDTGLSPKKSIKLNIPDVKRLSQMLDCIDTDDILLNIDSNSINYKSNMIKFKYHLWEENIGQSAILSVEKLNKLKFDHEFILSNKKINELLKASMVVPWPTDANKIYFFTKDKIVYAELTDKVNQNLDSITFAITDSFTGKEIKNVIPISLEIFRMISGLKFKDICVKINTELKILLFEIKEPDLILKYLVSSLIK